MDSCYCRQRCDSRNETGAESREGVEVVTRHDFDVDNARCAESCDGVHEIVAVTYPDGFRLGTWEMHAGNRPAQAQGYTYEALFTEAK